MSLKGSNSYVECIKDLEVSILNMLLSDYNHGILITSPAGWGKSKIVNDIISDLKNNEGGNVIRHVSIKGHITPLGLIQKLELYQGSGNLVILDDCDSWLGDLKTLNILKAATDVETSRRVTWETAKYHHDFLFNGKIVILTNLHERLESPQVTPLVSRFLYKNMRTLVSYKDLYEYCYNFLNTSELLTEAEQSRACNKLYDIYSNTQGMPYHILENMSVSVSMREALKIRDELLSTRKTDAALNKEQVLIEINKRFGRKLTILEHISFVVQQAAKGIVSDNVCYDPNIEVSTDAILNARNKYAYTEKTNFIPMKEFISDLLTYSQVSVADISAFLLEDKKAIDSIFRQSTLTSLQVEEIQKFLNQMYSRLGKYNVGLFQGF